MHILERGRVSSNPTFLHLFSDVFLFLLYLPFNGCFVVAVYSLSHVWLFPTPWTVARQAPLSVRFSRQEYWSGLLCPPPVPSQPRDQTHVSYISCSGRWAFLFLFLYHWVPPGKPNKSPYLKGKSVLLWMLSFALESQGGFITLTKNRIISIHPT